MPSLPPLDSKHLTPGVRARFVDGINGLRMHVLEHKVKTDAVSVNISISLGGVTTENHASDVVPEALIMTSDGALLEAKNNGRNCAVIKKLEDNM